MILGTVIMCLFLMGFGSIGFVLFNKYKDDEEYSSFAKMSLIGGFTFFIIAIIWLLSATGIYPIDFK